MSLDAAWAVGTQAQFAVMGVPATVTRPSPNDTPVETKAIWLSPADETQPFGVDLPRRDPRRVLAIQRSATVPELPRSTVITAPETQGGTVKRWRVDGAASASRPDELRVFVTEV